MADRNELKKKLKEKIKNQKIMRATKDQKQTFVDENLKKLGISEEDLVEFKKNMEKLNLGELNKQLKNAKI